jgi:predicted DNA-binding protein
MQTKMEDKMRGNLVRHSSYLKPETYQRLEALALANDRTLNYELEKALEAGLAVREQDERGGE